MGLGARLNFAFFTVIGVMVGTHVGVQIWTQNSLGIQHAKEQVKPIITELKRDIGDGSQPGDIPKRNEQLADKLASDPAFSQAFAAGDRAGVAEAIKSFEQRSSMPGFVTVFDKWGKVFYSGDSPNKFDYKPHDIADDILSNMRNGRVLYGPAAPTYTDTICLIGMVPIKVNGSWAGMVGVCEPLNSQFLTGLREKSRLTAGVTNVEILIFSIKDGVVTAYTPAMMQDQFQIGLNQRGIGLIDQKGDFERFNRYWTKYEFDTSNREKLAYLLVGAPMPDQKKMYLEIALEAALSVAAGVLLSLVFSSAISGRWNKSMRFLMQRAKDLQSQKLNLPPLEGLTAEFKELGEQIDTAVTGTRISLKSLQTQMGRHQEELLEKHKLVEEANSKVEAINRQLSIQSKQLSEVSKQINQASSQSILLQQKLASVLQVSTEGFLMLDAYGNVLTANPTFLNWIGLNESDVAGRYCFALVKKPGEPRENGHMDAFSIHNSAPGDLINHFYPEGIVYHTYEDKQVEVIIHLQPVMTDDHTVQGYVMRMCDKTLHGEAARLRTEMVGILQDSIRTPLAVAEQKWSRVLTSTTGQGQVSNPQLGTSLVDLHLSYQQLLGIVDSLLMMHTGIVPTSPIVREQVSVGQLIGQCLEQCAQTARDQHVMLDFKTATGLPTTAIDEHLVRDAMVQLIDRMVTATAPGGRVRVESSAKNNEIRTSIFSSGPAMQPEEVEELFAGFINGKHSEDSYSQRLSLYLVRNNIERIGGRIWAESDRGTYIYMVLPIQ